MMYFGAEFFAIDIEGICEYLFLMDKVSVNVVFI